MAKIHDPIDDFLAPLLRLGLKFPDIEAHVLWAEGVEWQPQDEAEEGLEGEEIAYYAEGLLLEGFGLVWFALAGEDSPAEPEHVLLYFFEDPAAPTPSLPAPPEGWQIMAQGRWPADP